MFLAALSDAFGIIDASIASALSCSTIQPCPVLDSASVFLLFISIYIAIDG